MFYLIHRENYTQKFANIINIGVLVIMEQKTNSFYRERSTLLGLIEALIGVPDVRVDMLHNVRI